MRDWWNDAGQTSTSTVGFITEEELASCSVTAAKMASGTITACQVASCAIETAKINAAAITTAKITDANVTSCKLSTNALTRTVILPFPKLTTTEAAGALSSTFVLMQPITVMNVQDVRLMNTAAWENATNDDITLFRNSSACVAAILRSSSTAWAAGTQSCAATIANALISANTLLTMKTNYSTCSVSSAGHIVVHYISTG